PTDAGGIIYVNLGMPQRARIGILAWARKVSGVCETVGGKGVPLAIDKAMLRKELDETRDRLAFEQQKSNELQALATRFGIVDFQTYDGTEGVWKLLFDYEFFWGLARLHESFADAPAGFRAYLSDVQLDGLAFQVSWDQVANLDRTRFYVAKVLRL